MVGGEGWKEVGDTCLWLRRLWRQGNCEYYSLPPDQSGDNAPWLEHKLQTAGNAAPKILGYAKQEEREGEMKRVAGR